jgi:ubiquinone/menaquinone biosynthesis C-methylase UbiE
LVDDLEHHEESYSAKQSGIALTVEQAAFGSESGRNGYTSLEQAQALLDCVSLDAEACLLDLGAGRGWPGTHIAETSGCRLVSTDIPMDALRAAKRKSLSSDTHVCREVVAAEALALPFCAGSFDAIVHADVFC